VAAVVDVASGQTWTAQRTTNDVIARLNKNWDEDVRAFDAIYEHILHMADALSYRRRIGLPLASLLL